MSEEEFELVEKSNGQIIKMYPDGRSYLVRNVDPIFAAMNENYYEKMQADRQLREDQLQVVDEKKSALNNAGLPASKSPI